MWLLERGGPKEGRPLLGYLCLSITRVLCGSKKSRGKNVAVGDICCFSCTRFTIWTRGKSYRETENRKGREKERRRERERGRGQVLFVTLDTKTDIKPVNVILRGTRSVCIRSTQPEEETRSPYYDIHSQLDNHASLSDLSKSFHVVQLVNRL